MKVRYAEDLKPLGFDLIKFNLSDVFYNTKNAGILHAEH